MNTAVAPEPSSPTDSMMFWTSRENDNAQTASGISSLAAMDDDIFGLPARSTDVHPEVEDALSTGKAVVALETALTTHGVPPPINLQLTRDLESVVRSTGCIPATIGIVAGRVKIGLGDLDLEKLADVRGNPGTAKISRRDIAPAIAMKANGGTTCSATLIFAALAGIKVTSIYGQFLGGVHRGGENSMDVSADLHELTRCPVGLVSAGVKSILDIGRCETLGIPVVPYCKTKDFPAFFSPRSGFQTAWNVSDPVTAARMLFSQWQLGMTSGALIAAPIPEEYAERGEVIQEAVDKAVLESEENGMSKRGKEVTPWLLSRVGELTNNNSLESNIALLKNTASIGGQIALQYQMLANESSNGQTDKTYAGTGVAPKTEERETLRPAAVLVVGSSALDISAQTEDMGNAVGLHSTSPGTVSLTLGGVARNIAEACHRLGEPALLVSPIGTDTWGHLLYEETKTIGMRTDGLIDCDQRTAVCNLFLDGSGNLVGGVADMSITEILTIAKHSPRVVALDGNLSSTAIVETVAHCIQHNIQGSEPTSIAKSEKILPAIARSIQTTSNAPVQFFTPNLLELEHIHRTARSDFELTSSPAWWSAVDSLSLGAAFRMDLTQLSKMPAGDDPKNRNTLSFLVDQGIAQMAVGLTPFFRHMFIKCGERGVLVVIRLSGEDALKSGWLHERSNPGRRYIVAHGDSGREILILQHCPARPTSSVINSTGAGDSFVGALLATLQTRPHPFNDPNSLNRLISTCQEAATLTLQT
ncbi:indigoidine synthase A-like protein [Mycena sp. CBHHK59/15]|nr:indigoidine synthase A-like protein [Mycena sp. CBHHK59/15]